MPAFSAKFGEYTPSSFSPITAHNRPVCDRAVAPREHALLREFSVWFLATKCTWPRQTTQTFADNHPPHRYQSERCAS